jgi:ABC-2 type transport system ATP-binding protein
MPIVEAHNLRKSFGVETPLKGINLAVQKGEIFGLIGPSGAGKSTLIRAFTGYLEPSEGEVRVFGRPPTTFRTSDRRRIGFLPQDFVLYRELSVRQNLNFVAGLYGLGFFERRRLVRQALEFVELWDHRRKAAAKISGGMQRRLQLAAATVHEPELLFVDEPTANLDPVLRRKFWEEFKGLRDQGRTIFVTTQYVGEAEACDRVAFLSGGKVAAIGTPHELRREAFGGELIELVLGGEPGHLGDPLSVLDRAGRIVEVHREEASGNPVSRIRLAVDDADVALPRLFEGLRSAGADVRSVDTLSPPFDEVFLHLVSETHRGVSRPGEKPA